MKGKYRELAKRIGQMYNVRVGLLGELLIERGAISVEQLHDGLAACRKGSGRLGTCLVDRGFIDERSLLEALAEQYSVPYVAESILLDYLGAMDSAVLPRSMLRRLRVIPFRQVRDRIQVAMSNPADTRIIDRIANYTQLHVEPFIASDRTIETAIELAKLLAPRGFVEEELVVEVAADEDHAEWDDLWAPRTDPEALLRVNGRPKSPSAVLVASFPSLVPVGSTEGKVRGLTTDGRELALHLSDARTAGDVAEMLAHFVAQRLDRLCLFAVHHGKISGWMSRGLPLDAAAIRSFSIFADAPSIFWEVDENNRYVGPIPSGPVNDDLAGLIGQPVPTEVLVVPIVMNGRAKGYLMGDIPTRSIPSHVRDEVVSAACAAGDALAAVLRGRN